MFSQKAHRAHEVQVPSNEILQQKLYSEMARIQFLAVHELKEEMKGTKESALVLETAVQKYEDLLGTHRGAFNVELLTSMIQGMSLIAERTGWIPALMNSHSHVVVKVLHQMHDVISSLTMEQVHSFFRSLIIFGPKIQRHPVIKTELAQLMDNLIDRTLPFLPQLDFYPINGCIQAVEKLNHVNSFRLLQGLYDHLPVYRERLVTYRVIWLIHVLGKHRFKAKEQLFEILDSDTFRFHHLPHGTIAYVLSALSRMPPSDTEKYLPSCLKRMKQVRQKITAVQASLMLKALSVMLYHPGDEILNMLINTIVQDTESKQDETIHHWGWSTVQHCAFLGHVHVNLIEIVRQRFLTHHEVYPLHTTVALLAALMHLDYLDQEVLDIARDKIRNSREVEMFESTVVKLARLHLYVDIVLRKETILAPERRQLLLPKWKEALSKSQKQAVPASQEVLETLQEMGYTHKGTKTVREEGLQALVLEKEGVPFCLEWQSFERHCYGKQPVPFYVDRWRINILKALGFGIIRLDRLFWNRCATKEGKITYIREMTSVAGASSPMFPEHVTREIEHRWKEPETDIDDDSGAEENNAFSEDVVGSVDFYENNDLNETAAHSYTMASHNDADESGQTGEMD